MIIKNIIITSLLTLAFAHNADAQQFNELTYTPTKSEFRLFAPDSAKKIVVRIYDSGLGGKPLTTIKMRHTSTDRWTALVKGNLKGKFYTFDISNDKK